MARAGTGAACAAAAVPPSSSPVTAFPSPPQFLCLKNIRTFLKVCHDKFGLRNSELFDPFDLFDVRDFGKVSGLFLRLGPPGVVAE